jgi:hypothetical protein
LSLLQVCGSIFSFVSASSSNCSYPDVLFCLLEEFRGFVRSEGQPDTARAARVMLKDFVDGRLLYCVPPPTFKDDERKAFHLSYQNEVIEKYTERHSRASSQSNSSASSSSSSSSTSVDSRQAQLQRLAASLNDGDAEVTDFKVAAYDRQKLESKKSNTMLAGKLLLFLIVFLN